MHQLRGMEKIRGLYTQGSVLSIWHVSVEAKLVCCQRKQRLSETAKPLTSSSRDSVSSGAAWWLYRQDRQRNSRSEMPGWEDTTMSAARMSPGRGQEAARARSRVGSAAQTEVWLLGEAL